MFEGMIPPGETPFASVFLEHRIANGIFVPAAVLASDGKQINPKRGPDFVEQNTFQLCDAVRRGGTNFCDMRADFWSDFGIDEKGAQRMPNRHALVQIVKGSAGTRTVYPKALARFSSILSRNPVVVSQP